MNKLISVLCAMAVLAGTTAVAPGQPGSAAICQKDAQESAESRVELSSAEKLYIRVQGFPELSSEYRINADDTISIPVIGRTSIAGMTAACLEEVLSNTASRIAKREVFVTVETAVYKPVFVTGAVAKPGAIPWFPGMTVLQASTIAGGLYRATTVGLGGLPDSSRIRKLAEDKKRALTKLARLRAEFDEAQTMSMPPELERMGGAEDSAVLMKAQETVFVSRRAARESEVASIERSIKVSKEELTALDQARVRVEEQLKARRALRDQLQGLLARGIIQASRGLEEDLKVAELEQKVLENSVARARVSATLTGLERENGTLRLGRRALIGTEMFELERELSQTTIELQALQVAAGTPAPTAKADTVEELGYAIIRRSGSESVRISAGERDVLRAGDVLIVTVPVY